MNPAARRRQGLAVAKPFPFATGPSPLQSRVLFSGSVSCYLVSRSVVRDRVECLRFRVVLISGKAQALMETRGIHLRCRSPPTILVIVSGGPRRGGTRNVK